METKELARIVELETALKKMLDKYPDLTVIQALRADKGLGYRKYPGDATTDEELVALWNVLLGAKKGLTK